MRGSREKFGCGTMATRSAMRETRTIRSRIYRHPGLRLRETLAVLVGLFLISFECARGVILFRTGDPDANTTVPSRDPAGSGWNYEGQFGDFLGTPIAPHFFLTAKHIGQAGSDFVFEGVTYTLTTHYFDPFSDLSIWTVVETFATFAPLYTSGDEPGLRLVVIGRGTQRGNGIFVGADLRGWYWGASDGVQRWGENIITNIVSFSSGPDDAIYATFDQDGLPNESHLSVGDSGGAVFIQDGAVWKLAGISYSVDGPFYVDAFGNGGFDGALFDARDFYYSDGGNPPNYVQITGPNPVPSGLYATRVSSKLAWIYSIIDPTGDADGNGRSNLLDYALILNTTPQPGYGMTPVSMENGFLALIYRKLLDAPSLQYQVEQSVDLVSWTPASSQDDLVRTDENVQTINARVSIGANARMFLRLRITESQNQPILPSTSGRAVYRTGSAR